MRALPVSMFIFLEGCGCELPTPRSSEERGDGVLLQQCPAAFSQGQCAKDMLWKPEKPVVILPPILLLAQMP